jgi:tetratricopeptide (TPR) repeat protein
MLLTSWPVWLDAQDFLGAQAVLRRAEAPNGKPVDESAKDPSSRLRDDLKSFSRSVTNLAADDAAQRWLELVDRAAKVRRSAMPGARRFSIPVRADDLLWALPPPTAWNELSQAISARPPASGEGELREQGLRLLAATLTADAAARSRIITNLQAKAVAASADKAYLYQNLLAQLSRTTLALSNDPDAILRSLGYQLASSPGLDVRQLEVPNLVSLIGREKAEAILRKMLVTPGVALEFNLPSETSRLARKLALELVDQIKTPQWGLVNSLDATELYEALDKRFPTPTNSIASLAGLPADTPDIEPGMEFGLNQKSGAQVYYVLGLISKGRTSEAIVLTRSLKGKLAGYLFDSAFRAMENSGQVSALDSFFHALLSQDPTLPYWDQYVGIAARAGQTERMLALVRQASGRQDLSNDSKAAMHQILFKALLAADDVDGGVEQARRLIALNATTPAKDRYSSGQLGVMMARIGVLLGKPELIEEGTTEAKKWLAGSSGRNPRGEGRLVTGPLTQILADLKRGPEAESILADALAGATPPGSMEAEFELSGLGVSRPILTQLVALYFSAGRYDDVVTLLEQSPSWGAKDLSGLFETSAWGGGVSLSELHGRESDLPVPYLAAASLAARSRKESAARINDALLDREPGLDRAYELLLSLDGTNAIRRLDELFARDQFQERPLIWKANLQRQQNQLDAAEQTIRQAIAIDPSDGEQGRGDRMRAYALLAEILDARGNKKDADLYREAVKAIRLSEQADQYNAAGLLKRAVAMYQDALKHFADAYCIQSRLAVQLAALGMSAQAEEHYRRAYELMPDSFGRVESHCFGCERVFDGDHAQGVAEKVFTKLAAERPDKAQVHYLLGFLRQEQERYSEALTNYLAAVRLDPDYLNAWVKAEEVSKQTTLSTKTRDEIAFNILRLDPLQRHSRSDFERVSDLSGLWQSVASAVRHQTPQADDLFALAASKAALEKSEKGAASTRRAAQFEMMRQMREDRTRLTPASAVAQTPFIRIAGEMILNNEFEFVE